MALLHSIAVVACLALGPIAQSPIVPDLDPRTLPTTPHRSNGSYEGRPALIVTTEVEWAAGNHEVEDANGQAVDLVVTAGGSLSVANANVRVVGNVFLEAGGTLRAVDSNLTLFNRRNPREFNFYWRGGHLDTRRCTVGGRRNLRFNSNFYLENGLWTARDTVVHTSGGILVGEIQAPPERQGGTLLADGLFPGETPDFIHLNGRCNVEMSNSAFGVSIRLFDPGPTTSAIRLDVTDDLIPHRVMGDPAVHAGVDEPIPGSPWRLAIDNSTVTRWALQFFEMGPNDNPRSYELVGAGRFAVGMHAEDLQGSPILHGPWRNHYPGPRPLPSLPTASAPGYHGIPPGCGVSVGPITLQSPGGSAGSWSWISAWNLYLTGPATDYHVLGPAYIAEIQVGEGTLLLEGQDAYDTGTLAGTIRAYETGRFTARNAVVGSPPFKQGEAAAVGHGRIELERVKLRKLLLRTGPQRLAGPDEGVDQGSIVLRDFVASTDPEEPLTIATEPGRTASVQVVRSTPDQGDDLSNLDFDAPLRANGLPGHWLGNGVQGTVATDTRPPTQYSSGARSFLYRSAGGQGGIWKRLPLPAGALVELRGYVKPIRLPNPAQLTIAVRGENSGSSLAAQTWSVGSWTAFHVPAFRVQPNDGFAELRVAHSGVTSPIEVLLDDFQVRIPTFDEDDNLVNLDFEEPEIRDLGVYPNLFAPPDYWDVVNGRTTIETLDLAPRTSGQRAVRLEVVGDRGTIRKRLRFPDEGRTLTISGWAKGIAGANNPSSTFSLFVGEGDEYWRRGWGNNQQQQMTTGSGWTPFSASYQVPAPPFRREWVTVAISGGANGDELLVDDVQVTIR